MYASTLRLLAVSPLANIDIHNLHPVERERCLSKGEFTYVFVADHDVN